MKIRSTIWKSIGAFVIGSVVLTSCLDDPEPAKLDALSDVFVQKIVQDDEVKYGIAFWVYGNKALSSVEVAGPGDGAWTLKKDESTSQVFALYPEDEDYADSMFPAGDYKFTIVSTQEGEEPIVVTDKLSDEELGVLVLESTEFDNNKLKIKWESLEKTENYVARLYDESGKLIFNSDPIAKEKTEFSFGNSDKGWINSSTMPKSGDTYRLDVLAMLYETGTTQDTKGYNVQFVSIASKEIVWD